MFIPPVSHALGWEPRIPARNVRLHRIFHNLNLQWDRIDNLHDSRPINVNPYNDLVTV